MARNKPWTRDELILALDLYFQLPPSQFDMSNPKVKGLSDLLAGIPALEGEHRNPNYRSPGGIAMKLANLAYLDTTHSGGLRAVGRQDKEVWNEFSGDPERVHALAEKLRAAIEGESQDSQLQQEDELEEATEGRILTRIHRSRERDSGIVRKKKTRELEQKGKLECEACHFDFEAAYGERGTGFIECHHTQPLHTLEPGSKTRLKDLALLCANCHRMVHARRPWLTLDELKALVQ